MTLFSLLYICSITFPYHLLYYKLAVLPQRPIPEKEIRRVQSRAGLLEKILSLSAVSGSLVAQVLTLWALEPLHKRLGMNQSSRVKKAGGRISLLRMTVIMAHG